MKNKAFIAFFLAFTIVISILPAAYPSGNQSSLPFRNKELVEPAVQPEERVDLIKDLVYQQINYSKQDQEIQNTFRLPGQSQPEEDVCSFLQMWECIIEKDCSWINGRCQKNQGAVYEDSCKNGKLDYGEVDVDCGGKCGPCDIGQNCDTNSNCKSQFCDFTPQLFLNGGEPTFKCKACDQLTADDNVQNCGETGIDCGGGFAQYPCHCYNGAKDIPLGESGVDCNVPSTQNPVCPICTFSQKTSSWDAPHCSDGILNKGEICTDCGGSCSHISTNAYPYCCDELECLYMDEFWCEGLEKCNSQDDKKSRLCFINKKGCEENDFLWCDTQPNPRKPNIHKCLEIKNAPARCLLTKDRCEKFDENFFWCTTKSKCFKVDEVWYGCFTSKEKCESFGFGWNKKLSKCYDLKIQPYYIEDQKTCEDNGWLWCDRQDSCGKKNRWSYTCFTTKERCEENGYVWKKNIITGYEQCYSS